MKPSAPSMIDRSIDRSRPHSLTVTHSLTHSQKRAVTHSLTLTHTHTHSAYSHLRIHPSKHIHSHFRICICGGTLQSSTPVTYIHTDGSSLFRNYVVFPTSVRLNRIPAPTHSQSVSHISRSHTHSAHTQCTQSVTTADDGQSVRQSVSQSVSQPAASPHHTTLSVSRPNAMPTDDCPPMNDQ